MVSLCLAHQEASIDIHFDFEVTLRSRDLRSPHDRSNEFIIYIFRYYQREDLDGAVGFALTQLVQKLLANTPACSQVPPF